MNIHILYGTESGNAELAADDIAEALADTAAPTVADLADTDPADLSPVGAYLILCSTYGDGELPASAQPFHDALATRRPDLAGVRYALFTLGDSGYDTYCQGGRILGALLEELGAVRVGEEGEHNASGAETVGEAAVNWARSLVSQLVPVS